MRYPLIIALLFLFLHLALSTEYQEEGCQAYAKWNGRNASDCGSFSNPCLTVSQAWNRRGNATVWKICIIGDENPSVDQRVNLNGIYDVHIERDAIQLVGIGPSMPYLEYIQKEGGDAETLYFGGIIAERIHFICTPLNSGILRIRNCTFECDSRADIGLFWSGGPNYQLEMVENTAINNTLVYLNPMKNSIIQFKNNSGFSVILRITGVEDTKSSFVDNPLSIIRLELGEMENTEFHFVNNVIDNHVNSQPVKGHKVSFTFERNLFQRSYVANYHFAFPPLFSNNNINYLLKNNTFENGVTFDGCRSSKLTIDSNVFLGQFRQESMADGCEISLQNNQFRGGVNIGGNRAYSSTINIEGNHFEGRDDNKPLLSIQVGGYQNIISIDILINNNKFLNNHIYESGGAIFISSPVSKVNITYCWFFNTSSVLRGGSISSDSKTVINNCTFREQSKSREGSIVWAPYSTLFIRNDVELTAEDSVVLSSPMNRGNWSYMSCPQNKILKESKSQNVTVWYGCQFCPNDYYTTLSGHYQDGLIMNPECYHLPQGMAFYADNSTYLVKGGYWCTMKSDSSLDCLKCPSGFCRDQDRGFDQLCTNNREGILCGNCKKGYTASLVSADCVNSSSCNRWWILTYFLPSVVYLILFVVRKMDEKTEMKTLIYFLQIYPLLTPTNPVSVVSSLLFSSTTASNEGQWRKICIEDGMDRRHIILLGLITSLFTPAVALLIWLITLIKGRISKKSDPEAVFLLTNDEMINGPSFEDPTRKPSSIFEPALWARIFLQALLLMYSSFLNTSLQLLRCVTINGNNVDFLNGNVPCESTAKNASFYIFFVVLFPIPLFLFIIWVFLRRREQSLGGTGQEILDVLQKSYRAGMKGWEPISIGRRTIFVCLFVFGGDTKPIMMILFCLLFLCLQIAFNPLATSIGNRLESLALACLLLISALELQNTVDITRDIQVIVVIFVVVVSVILFLVRPVWFTLGYLRRKILKKE